MFGAVLHPEDTLLLGHLCKVQKGLLFVSAEGLVVEVMMKNVVTMNWKQRDWALLTMFALDYTEGYRIIT